MENQPPPAQPLYISDADALQFMRTALPRHGHLLPSLRLYEPYAILTYDGMISTTLMTGVYIGFFHYG